MVKGQDAHHPLIRRHPVPFCDPLSIDEKVFLCEHHALREARCSGSINDQGFIVPPGLTIERHGRRLAGNQRVEIGFVAAG